MARSAPYLLPRPVWGLEPLSLACPGLGVLLLEVQGEIESRKFEAAILPPRLNQGSVSFATAEAQTRTFASWASYKTETYRL